MNAQPAIPALPAVLTLFIDALKPTMNILLVSAVWLGIAIPLLVILFYTSSQSSRRSGLFITNAIGICLGIAMAILNIAIQTEAIFNPLKGLNRPKVIGYTFLSGAVGLYVDSILLFRVLVVFPKFRTPRKVWYAIIIPLALIKIARAANLFVFMTQFVQKSKNVTNGAQYEGPLLRSLFEENVEWSLQLADNALCSGPFLWKLNEAQFSSTSMASKLKSSPYHKSLSTLFWIAATNFVFPCLFDIILFVLFFKDANGADYLIVVISNTYVQIIGVLFATIWRGTHTSASEVVVESLALPQTQDLSMRFAPNWNAGSGGNVETTGREKEISGPQRKDLDEGSSMEVEERPARPQSV